MTVREAMAMWPLYELRYRLATGQYVLILDPECGAYLQFSAPTPRDCWALAIMWLEQRPRYGYVR